MLCKTKGIFLRKIQYSESRFIVKVYTREYGILSFGVRAASKGKGGKKINMLQHLTLLDMDISFRENLSIQSVKEWNISCVNSVLLCDVVKGSVAMFMNELVQHTIKEQESNEVLFDFLVYVIDLLEKTTAPIKNIPLIFMLHLSKYAGFLPQGLFSSDTPYFDMMEGRYVSVIPDHAYVIEPVMAEALSHALAVPMDMFGEYKISAVVMRKLMSILESYYTLHIPGFRKIHSLEVLHAVFH